MKIEQGKLFEYVFFLYGEEATDEDRFKQMKKWFNENLNGQWIIFDNKDRYTTTKNNTKLSYHSRAIHDLPLQGATYKPASVDIVVRWVVAFEREDDAAAFKLKWS